MTYEKKIKSLIIHFFTKKDQYSIVRYHTVEIFLTNC